MNVKYENVLYPIEHQIADIFVVLGMQHQLMPLNFLTAISDQDRISPYNINTISSRQVMRIKRIIN